MKGTERKSSISIGLTLLIITLLILSGPASAVSINVSSLPTKVVQGKSLSFTIDINISAGEKIPISNISINVTNSTGNSVGNYAFSPDGKNLTSGINVSLITSAPPFGYGYRYGYGYTGALGYQNYTFGYGYGYGYGYSTSSSKFKYNIIITDFSKLPLGSYSLRILVDTSTGKHYTTIKVPVVGVVPAPAPVIVPVSGVTTNKIKISSIGNITVKAGANVTVGIPLHSASVAPDVNIYLENLPSGWSAKQLKGVTLPSGDSKAEIELMVPENVTVGTNVLVAVASAWFGKAKQKFYVIVTSPAKKKPSNVTIPPPVKKKPSNVTIPPPVKKKPSNVTIPPPAKKKPIFGLTLIALTLIALLVLVSLALGLRRRRRV